MLSTLLLVLSAHATDWYVDDDARPGGDGRRPETAFDTLQEALLTAADHGDTVYVGAGHYSDAWIWRSGVTVVGVPGATIIDDYFAVHATLATLRGLTFTSKVGVYYGYFEGHDLRFEGPDTGVVVLDDQPVTLDDCVFEGSQDAVLVDADGVFAPLVKITDSHFIDVKHAYRERSDAGLVFRRNEVDATDTALVFDHGGRKTVHRNRFFGYRGVDVSYGTGKATISGNLFLGRVGVRLSSADADVVHNTFVHNDSAVLCRVTAWSDTSVVLNNVFLDNGIALYGEEHCDLDIRGNAFAGNDMNLFGWLTAGPDNVFRASLSLSPSYGPTGMFSPLVGAAVSAPGPTRDFYGVRRGIPGDIGAVEYVSTRR